MKQFVFLSIGKGEGADNTTTRRAVNKIHIVAYQSMVEGDSTFFTVYHEIANIPVVYNGDDRG
jgi:hypothetical protein